MLIVLYIFAALLFFCLYVDEELGCLLQQHSKWTRDESGHRQSNPLFSRAAHPHTCHHLLFASLPCQCHQDHHLYAHHCMSNIIIDHYYNCVIVCIAAFQVQQFGVGFSGRLVVVLLLFCYYLVLFCFVDRREMGCLFISIPGWSRVALGSPDAWWRPLRPPPQLPRAHRTTIFYWSSVSQFLTSSVASSSQLVAQNNNLLLVLHKCIMAKVKLADGLFEIICLG